MAEMVRIEVQFVRPQGASLEDCAKLVMNQMKASPQWEKPEGTGLLNYVCFDSHLRLISARLIEQ